MKETLVTISKRTGFAISTVSRVLNGQAEKYRISRKTVELILAEARRCDYTPSLLAKGLRMKRTNTLGLLIPQVSNPYFADIASAIIREARSHGYTVMVVDTMENEENEQEGIRTMLSRRVDGIVAVPCGRTPDHLEKVDRSVPVMLVDRSFERTSLPYVCTDNYRGGVEATRILLQRGHRRIACIQGVPHSMPNRRRVQGYLDALRQAGLQEEAIITGDAFSLENGYRQTKLAVAGPDRPTAIFALSNTILLGAVKAIRESGLRIPEDISVVSFDDNPYLDFLVPAITRIGQPVEEIGKTAVRLLLESIREEVRCRTQLQLPPERIVRDSVANPRTAKYRPLRTYPRRSHKTSAGIQVRSNAHDTSSAALLHTDMTDKKARTSGPGFFTKNPITFYPESRPRRRSPRRGNLCVRVRRRRRSSCRRANKPHPSSRRDAVPSPAAICPCRRPSG